MNLLSRRRMASLLTKEGRAKYRGIKFVAFLGIIALFCVANLAHQSLYPASSVGHSRALLGEACAGEFDQRSVEPLVVYAVLVAYAFLGIAIVCDDFFMPALEVISDKLQLSEDVAGCTFLAFACSAPELSTSFVDTFVFGGDGAGMGDYGSGGWGRKHCKILIVAVVV